MKEIIVLIIVILVIYLLYEFYPKINTIVQKYIISPQNVERIKKKMIYLENNEIIQNNESVQNNEILENINEILYLPIDFIYKIVITYGKPLFYNLSYKNI
jgi:predicted PurR-regulated permease PerM